MCGKEKPHSLHYRQSLKSRAYITAPTAGAIIHRIRKNRKTWREKSRNLLEIHSLEVKLRNMTFPKHGHKDIIRPQNKSAPSSQRSAIERLRIVGSAPWTSARTQSNIFRHLTKQRRRLAGLILFFGRDEKNERRLRRLAIM